MRDWLNRGPLMDAAGDGGAGGGAGGEGDKAPQFEPAKFKTELMGEVTKMLNGGLSRIEKQLAGLKPPPAAGEGEGDKGEGDKGGKPKDPEVARLLKTVEKLTGDVNSERTERIKAQEAGREKERLSLIRTELAKHGLADHALDDAFRFFRDEVKYTEGGEIVGGPDELPLADFVKSTVEKRTHWLPPVPAGGAGATAGRGGRGTPVITLDQIGLNMTKEQRTAAYAAIQQALR
jgi:hypothetical protein